VKEHLVNYISCENYILIKVKLVDLIEFKVGWVRELGVVAWLWREGVQLLGVGAHALDKASGPYA